MWNEEKKERLEVLAWEIANSGCDWSEALQMASEAMTKSENKVVHTLSGMEGKIVGYPQTDNPEYDDCVIVKWDNGEREIVQEYLLQEVK